MNDAAIAIFKNNFQIWSINISYQSNNLDLSAFSLIMQSDGNLVVYDSNKMPVWASNTWHIPFDSYKLIMQNDGNLVIYRKDIMPVWASGTWQP